MTHDFAAVYDRHVDRVFAFLAYRSRDREAVEDLTQQTFERALRSWERYDARRGSELTWLLTIARNLLIDHARADRSGQQEPLEDDFSELSTAPADEPGVAPELASALSALSDRERELIALRYGGSLTGPEIAAMTGLQLANVQQILSRGLRKLRAALEA